MKKFLAILIGFMLVQSISMARDYTKLQKREMGHAQKYGSTNRYFGNYANNQTFAKKLVNVKDPKIINLGIKYNVISDDDYDKKLKEDEKEYASFEKGLKKITFTNYNAQAQGRDYYKVYRIAERIIRANRLDYQPWRIGITRESREFNAFSMSGNYIELYTSAIDSFIDNEDALAMIIGHEIGHLLLGHGQRKIPDYARMERMKRIAKAGNIAGYIHYAVLHRKILIDSKNMEYAADIEGAKLITKAGYDLNKAVGALTFMETIGHDRGDYHSDHPTTQRRIESFNQNREYFPVAIWKDMGRYNIYNTPVLEVTASSDRKSIVITSGEGNKNPSDYYRPETMEQIYTRFGYCAYINGNFKKSLENFDKLFESGSQNASAYLYASYAANELYKKTQDKQYRTKAINYIKQAEEYDPNNKYIKEQAESL